LQASGQKYRSFCLLNIGPHDYQAKPEDAQKLSQADVLVQNGLEMEAFLDDLVKNASRPELKVIDSSAGVATIATEEIEGETHEGEAHAHEHGEFNPHIWLDPKRAIEQVENIRDGLIAADPEGKDTYTANAAAYIEKLRNLDSEIATTLQPYAGKTFVAFHDFAPYFAESYDLKAQFLVDIPEDNPAPEDVKRIMETVQATNLKTILNEPQAGEDAFTTLGKDLNVRVSQFNPGETGETEALEPDYYFTMMRQNLKNLKSAFAEQSTQSFLPQEN
jgi:zinc transport system substrate-binding protein